MYTGYGIVFDDAGSVSFDIDFARNVVIFGVTNSLHYNDDNSYWFVKMLTFQFNFV